MDNYIGRIGILKTRNVNPHGRKQTLASGRIHVSPDALASINLKAGDKYSVRCGTQDRDIEIVKTTNGSSKVLGGAESVRFQYVHFLDFNGANCRIAAQNTDLTDVTFTRVDDKLIFTLPETVLRTHSQLVAQQRSLEKAARKSASADKDWRDVVRGKTGAAAAIALEAHRYELNETPVAIEEMVGLLREEGHRVAAINGRLWHLDGQTATLSDLLDLARKYQNDLVLVAA